MDNTDFGEFVREYGLSDSSFLNESVARDMASFGRCI
jgi:hypothetical protein